MRFSGRIFKDRKFWLSEIPILDVMTQGCTKKECVSMTKDLIRTMANEEGLEVEVYTNRSDEIEISSPDTKTMVKFLLQRKREMSGMSLTQVAEKMGAKSRNTYARYE